MIAITGDLIDSRDTDVEIALDFVREAVKSHPAIMCPAIMKPGFWNMAS